MTAEQWQRSVLQLYGTAESLQAGAPVVPLTASVSVDVVDTVPDAGPASRSTARMLASTAVHSALTIGVLMAGFALADPILPHPERPHLAGPDVEVDLAIPRSAADRP